MRRDDHELVGGLAGRKFRLKPSPPCCVKKPMAMDVDGAVVFPLGIVEHDDLERHIRFRQEAVTGKTGSAGRTVEFVEPD